MVTLRDEWTKRLVVCLDSKFHLGNKVLLTAQELFNGQLATADAEWLCILQNAKNYSSRTHSQQLQVQNGWCLN